MTKRFNWKIFFILWAAAIVGLVAIIPYSLALQGPGALEKAAAQTSMPLAMLLTVQIASQAIVFGLAIWIGLGFANSVGLELPILEAAVQKAGGIGAKVRAIAPISIILGAISALILVAADAYIFQPALLAQMGEAASKLSLTASASTPTWWQGLLASLYGAFDEELLVRLCVMSFLVWVGRFVSKTAEGKPTLAVLWSANVLAAIVFGLGHLPGTAAVLSITPLVVIRAVVLNGLIGVAFGYLYFTRGLESAMLSHFSADIVLHVLFAI